MATAQISPGNDLTPLPWLTWCYWGATERKIGASLPHSRGISRAFTVQSLASLTCPVCWYRNDVFDQVSGVEPSLHFFPHAHPNVSHTAQAAIKHLSQGCGRVSHYVAMTGPNLHLDNTIGCFFVGMVLATILYGCTCAQVLYYLWQYPEDRMNFKLFVALLWALDTATTATHIQTIWGFLLSGHSKVEALTVMPTAGPIEWFLAATIIVIVQLYYILTIWKLVGERWFQLPITVMATLLSLLSYAFGIQDTHLIITHPALPGVFMSSKGRTASFLQPLFAAIADIYITVALTMLLRREKSEFKRTSSILRKLTVHIINRGVLTAILQSLQAILFAAYRSNGFYWSLFAFPGTRVYIISTLAVLNARRSNRLGVDSAASFSNDIQLNAVHSHRSRVYSRYTYQEQPMTPPSGASDKFIMLTTEVVHRVN